MLKSGKFLSKVASAKATFLNVSASFALIIKRKHLKKYNEDIDRLFK